jgi:hypothetical protein
MRCPAARVWLMGHIWGTFDRTEWPFAGSSR